MLLLAALVGVRHLAGAVGRATAPADAAAGAAAGASDDARVSRRRWRT